MTLLFIPQNFSGMLDSCCFSVCTFLKRISGKKYRRLKNKTCQLQIISYASKTRYFRRFQMLLKQSGLIALICCFLISDLFYAFAFSNGPWTKLLSNEIKVTKDLLEEKKKNFCQNRILFQLCEVITRTLEAFCSFFSNGLKKYIMYVFAHHLPANDRSLSAK